jgi:uncharacterized protein YjbI with pentapeptide repeats
MTLRRIVFAGLSFAAIQLLAPHAHATSCAPVDDPDAFVAEAGAIFEGELLERVVTKPAPPGVKGVGGPEISATFRVFTAYKGSIGPTVHITYIGQDGVNGGAAFSAGKKETIILFGNPKQGYTTDMCGQAAIANGREEILAAAERYRNRLLILHRDVVFWRFWYALPEARLLAENNAATEALAVLKRFENIWQSKEQEREAILLASRLHVSLGEDELGLQALQQYLASEPYDPRVDQARILLLVRLHRASEIPSNWRDYTDLDAAAIDFSGRYLEGASFRSLKAAGANFARSKLAHADFSGADINLGISGGKVEMPDFSNTDLQGANFRDASVSGTFNGANLARASLVGARLGIDLTNATLEEADARGAQFNWGASYIHFKARHLNAAGATINVVDLTGADFSGGDLRAATFGLVNLTGADFSEADLRQALLDHVDLTHADLQDADLRMASLKEAVLTGIHLTGALYDARTVWPAGFDPDKAGAKRE